MSDTKSTPIWHQDEAARLGDEIRRTMTRLSDPALAGVANATIGRLIDQRIEDSYQRGLQAAMAAVRKK
jgi:hypothetical protein